MLVKYMHDWLFYISTKGPMFFLNNYYLWFLKEAIRELP